MGNSKATNVLIENLGTKVCIENTIPASVAPIIKTLATSFVELNVFFTGAPGDVNLTCYLPFALFFRALS